ncbi:hypothetical protein FRC06_005121 [Ceratobasidium sp. 370]|nr:hypothetical protein FRC06_005121 [Ceratobasidium sp. 370]
MPSRGRSDYYSINPDNIGLILMCDGVRPENKILLGITLGPKEPGVDTIHHFLKPIVDQLLKFWNEGMEFVDPDGNTQIIRAALIACVCDSPEARKLGGFPGNGAMYPCTVCWCSRHELHMFETVFDRRTRKQHKRASKRYQKLPNQNQRDNFIKLKYTTEKPGGYRYSELLRLPYWDPTKMIVVDAMHCLFLGLVKWQFHEVWIKMKHLRPGSELDELQKMVQLTLRPRHCGKPPHALGTEAGGSLTADPLCSLVSIDLPLAIPVIWDMKREENKVKRQKGNKKAREAEKARQHAEEDNESPPPPPRKRQRKLGPSSKRKHNDQTSEGKELPEDARVMDNAERPAEDDAADRSQLSWRKQDAEGILLLASAIKYLCARTVSQENIKKGEEYLKRYLVLLAQRMCPNHHYSTHIPMNLSLYGPMGGIWTYSGERLNYDLKHTNNNSRGGAFIFIGWQLTGIAANKEDPLCDWAEYMLALDHSDVRGTFAAEAADAQTTNSRSFKHTTRLSHEQRQALGSALQCIRPDLPFRYKAYEESNHPILDSDVKSVCEVTLNGRTYSMTSLHNGIVKVYTVEDGKEAVRVGEILDIWEHTYYSLSLEATVNTFALVHWYQTSTIFAPRSARLWLEEFEHLDIDIHPQGRYIEQHAVIPISEIRCHCAHMSATVDGKPVWLTIPIERE